MKKFLLFSILLLLLIVAPASASLINTSCIVGVNPLLPADYSLKNGFSITAPDSSPVLIAHKIVAEENSVTTITFTQNSGSTITVEVAYIVLTPYAGIAMTKINGGTAKVIPYPRFGILSTIWSPAETPVVTGYTVDSAGKYYLVSDSEYSVSAFFTAVGFIGSMSRNYRYIINTSEAAYIEIDNPNTNPIRTASYSTNANSGTVSFIFNTQEAVQINSKEATTSATLLDETTHGNWYDDIVALFKEVYKAFTQLIQILGVFAGYWISGIWMLFVAEVFLTIIAVYTVISAVLSIHDTDNLFVAFGKFWRREMKLLRFFMDIVKYIKRIIKWW